MSVVQSPTPTLSTHLSNAPTRLSEVIPVENNPIGKSIVRCLNKYETMANTRGLLLELRTDFLEFNEMCMGLDRAPVWSAFNPEYCDIGPLNGFWILGTDSRGSVVHTQAVRFDDLSGTCLATHFTSLRAFYRDPEKSAHPDETCTVEAPAPYGITGRVCYQGELWVEKSYRGRDLGFVLPKLSMAIALARWSPDYLYGFVAVAGVKKGNVAKYGHYNLQPHGAILNQPQYDIVHDDWLEWATWREMVDQIERS